MRIHPENDTFKYITHKKSHCLCGFEFDGKNAEIEARRHTQATGHITTMDVSFDIAPVGETVDA